MEGDPLADILTLASARCVRIGTLRAGGTWALRFPPPQKIKLTAVVKGACWLAVDRDGAPVRLETGDVFMVPADRAFVLASDLKVRPLDGLELFMKTKDNVGKVGDGNDFLAIGGHVALDPDRGGVLAEVLPPLIHVDGSSPEASTIRWLLDQLVPMLEIRTAIQTIRKAGIARGLQAAATTLDSWGLVSVTAHPNSLMAVVLRSSSASHRNCSWS
jgi:hypothetical protein